MLSCVVVVFSGSATQEEQLFRRSTYMVSHWDWTEDTPASLLVSKNSLLNRDEKHCLGPRVEVTTGTWVFRSSPKDGYELLRRPFRVDFIAQALKPRTDANKSLSKKTKEEVVNRLTLLLRACHAIGATHLVLGAIGCGAFNYKVNKIHCQY